METLAYTVAGVTTEVSLGQLGIGFAVKIEWNTHGASTVTLPFPAIPPETQLAIPFEAQCILYTGRVPSGGGFSGGTKLFQGRRTDNSGHASADSASQQLILEDAWYDLRFLTYQMLWRNITNITGTAPNYNYTYGASFVSPDCVLFQVTIEGLLQPNGTFGAYPHGIVAGHIVTGDQVRDILAYAIYAGGVNLQIGQIDPAALVPWYPIRSIRCADALKHCLRPHPDCTCEIDHTTTPPTFNIRQRSNLTPITLPYKSASGAITHLTSDIKPRPELIPTRVNITIHEVSTINGQPITNIYSDIYPLTAPTTLRSLDASVDMTGPKISRTLATLTSAAFDPTSLAWWSQKVPALKPQPAGQIPASGTGSLALLDATINGGISGHPKGIQVVDDSGNPIALGNYGYELLTGTPAAWMILTGGQPVQWIDATVVGFFSYYKETTAGSANLVDQIGEHMHTCRVKLINTSGATFLNQQIQNTGETYPTGLAYALWNTLQQLQYNFTHEIFETPFATVVKPGKHALNLTGPGVPPGWTTMNAMVQSVELELMFTPGANIASAKTTIKCGPVDHLEPGELIQVFNMFQNRNLSSINPNERATGQDQGAGNVTLGNDSPKENSVPATSVPALQNLAGTDTVTGANTNTIQLDATTAQIKVTQNNSGGQITSGIIGACYSASGAPASGTLATNANYRIGDFYWDTTNKIFYRCTTAGSNSTSVWSQVGGSGGSLQGFKIISDGGDYWNCYTWDGYALGGTSIKVAKPWELMCGTNKYTTATIRSITYTFSYTASGGYYSRSTSISGGTFAGPTSDYMDPDPAAFPYIYAMGVSFNASSSLTGIVWQDINANGRYWAIAP